MISIHDCLEGDEWRNGSDTDILEKQRYVNLDKLRFHFWDRLVWLVLGTQSAAGTSGVNLTSSLAAPRVNMCQRQLFGTESVHFNLLA